MKRHHDKHRAKPEAVAAAAATSQPAAPRSRKRFIGLGILLVLVAASVGFGSWSYQATVSSRTYTAAYVGRTSCASCHKAEAEKFIGSHHDLAMDLATPATVVDPAAFDGREFTAHGVTSKFSRQGDKFFVRTDGPTGALEDFEVKYVFGVDPLQQYMIEFADKQTVRNPQGQELELPANRVQVLSIAWDVKKKEWFHLYPDRKFAAGDWLHWTGGGQNWNYMCAKCHSTDLQKNFDLAANSYHTTFNEIDVSCEACHGPAGEHVARAQSALGFNDPRHFHSYALNPMKGAKSPAEIETCALCHSHHHVVHGDYRPGRNIHDFLIPTTTEAPQYYADGQIRDEVYEYGSFLQSRMFREGVKCSNCHDPHSLKPKFEGNALCAQCHMPAKYDTPSHHHHKFDSAGAKCVECHMPETKYMQVDPRRDHSIRIPRPDLTKKLGTPNACAPCHKKEHETTDWLMAKYVEWWGPKRFEQKHYGETLAAGRAHDPHAAAALIDLAKDKPLITSDERAAAVGPVVRAGAAALLSGYYDEATSAALRRAFADADPQVRTAAIRAVDQRPTDVMRPFRKDLMNLLDDPIRSVRTTAARALTRLPPPPQAPRAEQQKFQNVFQEWLDGQAAEADRAEPHAGIGTAYLQLLRSTETMAFAKLAEEEFIRSRKIDPSFVPAILGYAELMDVVNRDAEAEKLFREVVELVPKLDQPDDVKKRLVAEADYQLGWLLMRDPGQKRLGEALVHLDRALAGDPDNYEALHHKGIALLGLNRYTDGAAALTAFYKRMPEQSGTLLNFAEQALRNGQNEQARTLLEVLIEVDPQARTKHPRLGDLLRQAAQQ